MGETSEEMKKTIIFLHGFFASGSCVPATALKEAFEGKYNVLTSETSHPQGWNLGHRAEQRYLMTCLI